MNTLKVLFDKTEGSGRFPTASAWSSDNRTRTAMGFLAIIQGLTACTPCPPLFDLYSGQYKTLRKTEAETQVNEKHKDSSTSRCSQPTRSSYAGV